MNDEIAEFVGLSNLRASTDATRMSFRIDVRDRAPIDLSCKIDEVPAIISYLARAAAAIRLGTGEPDLEARSPQRGLTESAQPIPISGAAFVATDTPDIVCLMLHLAMRLNLGFAIPHSQLQTLAANLSRTARTLSADHRKKN